MGKCPRAGYRAREFPKFFHLPHLQNRKPFPINRSDLISFMPGHSSQMCEFKHHCMWCWKKNQTKKVKRTISASEIIHRSIRQESEQKQQRNKAIPASMRDGVSWTHTQPASLSCQCCRKEDFQRTEIHNFSLFVHYSRGRPVEILHFYHLSWADWQMNTCKDTSTYLNSLLRDSGHKGQGRYYPAVSP